MRILSQDGDIDVDYNSSAIFLKEIHKERIEVDNNYNDYILKWVEWEILAKGFFGEICLGKYYSIDEARITLKKIQENFSKNKNFYIMPKRIATKQSKIFYNHLTKQNFHLH